MRSRLVIALLAVLVLTAADEPSGGSLETVSGSARIVERAGGLTLVTGIRARCRRGPCTWTAAAASRGRPLGRARGELATGGARDLRVRIVRRLRRGNRVPVRIDATLAPGAGADVALVRTVRVRVPR